jgi:hypothetical protein
MVKQDFEHLAQVVQSVRFQVTNGTFPEDEFERLIDRMVWAIQSSPGGSREFDSDAFNRFRKRCHGEIVAEETP